jgi:hypothetical protein
MEEKIIGNILFKICQKEIKETNVVLKNSEYKKIDLSARPLDLIVLPNNLLLSADYLEKSFSFYDENFNLVKRVNKIGNKKIEPYSITTNNKNYIYTADLVDHQIIMMDFELNEIKSFGSKGSSNSQFDVPCGIVYINDHLYVCDYNNKRIQVLSADLEFVRSIMLCYNPWLISASDKTLCVSRGDLPGGVYFYDIGKLKLRYKHQIGECRTSEINSCFYAFSFKNKKMFSFDKYGILVEEINVDRFKECFTNIADGCLVRFKKNLILSIYLHSCFVIFNI